MEARHKNILIGVLLGLVLIMAVGYAAFASNLTINGTSNISTSWNVHIKTITPSAIASGTYANNETTYTSAGSIKHEVIDAYTAEFSAILLSPSESVTYTVVVENTGTIDATLNGITFSDSTMGQNNPTDAILYTYSGIAIGDDLLANGGTDSFTVIATYNPAITTQPTLAQLTKDVTMVLNYVQKA
ncbi:MAG: hypothetical protein IKG27_04120 [Bacilli bacterium]|nr:hypothetical protein [Bacilli bacterium]